jgi:hypothetical protein
MQLRCNNAHVALQVQYVLAAHGLFHREGFHMVGPSRDPMGHQAVTLSFRQPLTAALLQQLQAIAGVTLGSA